MKVDLPVQKSKTQTNKEGEKDDGAETDIFNDFDVEFEDVVLIE